MTNEISTQVNEWVIVQHSGAVKYITEELSQKIIEAMASGANGFKDLHTKEWMTFSTIADIISLEEYYRRYPDKALEERKEYKIEDDRYAGLTVEQIAELNQYRFKGLLKGLKQFIDEQLEKKITPKYAIAIYNEKLERYKKKFGVSQTI